MIDGPDPLDRMRKAAESPTPSGDQERHAWARLQDAIAAEKARARKALVVRRRWLPTTTVILAAAVVTAGVVSLVGSNPAEATLIELAQAARRASLLEVPPGGFVYTRSERIDLAQHPGAEFGLDRSFVSYLLPTSREVWRDSGQRFFQMQITVDDPMFFDAATEAAYYASNLHLHDRVGETTEEQFVDVRDPVTEVDWPTDPALLRESMEDHVVGEGDVRPVEVRIFDLAADLLRENNVPPDLRAALLEVLARLPIELVERHPDGSATFSISYQKPLATRDTKTFSAEGYLLAESSALLQEDAESGIPMDTIVESARYSIPKVVETLETP